MSGAGNEERRPGGGRRIVEHEQRNAEATPQRPARTLYAWARTYTILSCRGTERTLLVVLCPFCSTHHAHSGKADFVQGVRRASCHRGRYTLLGSGREDTTRRRAS